MKKGAFIAVVVLLAWLGWYWAASSHSLSDPANLSDRAAAAPPTQTVTDPAVVFQRAFWKHPNANDRILHAERREWAAGDGVKKWQWFIAVRPSPELVKYLRDDNAFNLARAPAASAGQDAPAWFSFEPGAVEALKAPMGSMFLAFSKVGNVLYATDSGDGFRPGAAEAPPPPPLAQSASSGRLPTTSPPRP